MRKNSFIGDQVAADMQKTLGDDSFKKIFASPVVEAEEQAYTEALSEDPSYKAFVRFASKVSEAQTKTIEQSVPESQQIPGKAPIAAPGFKEYPGKIDPFAKQQSTGLDIGSADDKDDKDEEDDKEDKEDKKDKKKGKPKKGEQPPWLKKKDKKDEKEEDKEEKEEEEEDEDKEDKKDEDDTSYAMAFNHIVDTLIRTSEALEGMGLKVTARQSLLLLDNIIEEVARHKFAQSADIPVETPEEISVEEEVPAESLKERIEELPEEDELEDILAEPPEVGEGLEEGIEEPLNPEEEEIAVAFKELNKWVKQS